MKAPSGSLQGVERSKDAHSASEALMQLMLIRGNDRSAPPDQEEPAAHGSKDTDAGASARKADSLSRPDCDETQSQDSGSDFYELFSFEYGVHYALLEGRLYFSFHPDEAFTVTAIQRDKSLFYFSSSIPGMRWAVRCIMFSSCIKKSCGAIIAALF
jgi:hypothetical protein